MKSWEFRLLALLICLLLTSATSTHFMDSCSVHQCTCCLVLLLFFLFFVFVELVCAVVPPRSPLSFPMNYGGIGRPYVYFMQTLTDKLSHHTGSQIDHVFLRLTIIQLSFRKRWATHWYSHRKFFCQGLTLFQLPADHSWCEGHDECSLCAIAQLPTIFF